MVKKIFNRFMHWIVSRATMNQTKVSAFVDCVNGRTVFIYEDYYGDEFLAQTKFGTRILKPKTICVIN